MSHPAEQTAIWFAAVSARVLHFLQKLVFRPRRFTSRIPRAEYRDGLVVGKVETPHDAATDPECPKIPMIASNRGLDRLKKSASAGYAIVERARDAPVMHGSAGLAGRGSEHSGKVRGNQHSART